MINQLDLLPFLFSESKQFWLTSGNKDEPAITCRADYAPSLWRQDYATKLAQYLNRTCYLFGGTVLVGFKDETFPQQLYIVVLDDQGQARTAIDYPKDFREVEKWKFDTFQYQVEESINELIQLDDEVNYKLKYWGDLSQKDFV